VTRQPVNHNIGQRDNITPPSTSRHQHRSTSSAGNIYRHLPVLHHRHLRLYYYVRYHHQPVHHLRHSFLWIIGVNTIRITHLDYLLGLPTWITYMDYLSTSPRTTADYPRSRTINCNNIVCHWLSSFMNCFIASSCNVARLLVYSPFPFSEHSAVAGCARLYLFPYRFLFFPFSFSPLT